MNRIARFVALIPVLLISSSAHATDKKDCKPLEWADPLPGYELHACDERIWGDMQLYVPGIDGKWLGGQLRSVTYHRIDDSKNATAMVARDHFIEAGTRAGAALVKKTDYDAYLKKSGPKGDVWLIYQHGSGNEKSTSSYTVYSLEVMPVPQEVEARRMPGPLEVGHDKDCANPPWVVKALPGYKIVSCDSKQWDATTYDLDKGKAEVMGRRVTVHYRLADEKQVVVGHGFHAEFLQAVAKTGAEIRRAGGAADSGPVIATEKTPAGEFWLDARGTGGSDDWVSTYSLTTWQVEPLPQQVVARPMKGDLETAGCEDPRWLVKQFADYTRAGCKNRDFDSVTFWTRDGKKTVAGRVQEVNYKLNDEKQNPVALAVWTNYVEALKKTGAEMVSKPDDRSHAVFTEKTPEGEFWIEYRHGSGNSESTTTYTLATVQIGAPPKCTTEIYGINFDFDKATLRPDSEPVLNALLALFKKDPKLSGQISGHTDNVGKPDYNKKLSGERAEAVKAWLVAKGIAASRLTTKGYGDTKPLVPNTNDENRAKNRRVELTRENCLRK